MTDVTLGSLTAAGTLPAGAAVLVRQPSSAGATTYVLGAVNVSALYTLPTASNSVLGGIKIGTGLTIDQTGTVSASGTAGVSTFNTRTGAVTLRLGDVTDVTGTGATARSNLGLAAVAATGAYADLTGVPAAGAPLDSPAFTTKITLPNVSAGVTATGAVVYNTTTGRYEFGTGAGTANHVRLGGDTMTGVLNLFAGSTVPTPTAGDNTTKIASTAFVAAAVAAGGGGGFSPTSVLRTFDNGAVVSAGTLYFIGSSPWAGNILSLDSKCGTGSYSVAIQINGVTVTGLSAVNVSGSTSTNTAATAAYSFPAGAVITAVVSAPAGSPTDSFLNLRIQRTA